jgi:hypothetical protein
MQIAEIFADCAVGADTGCAWPLRHARFWLRSIALGCKCAPVGRRGVGFF